MNGRALWSIALTALAACSSEPAEEPTARAPLTVTAAEMTVEEIDSGAVTGTVAGRSFTADDVRIHVVEVPGEERVDLLFSEQEIRFCGVPGQPVEDRSSRLWIRAAGTTRLDEGVHRIEADGEDDLEAHFEFFDDGRWRGVGRAAALLSVEGLGEGSMIGRLRACFDDGQGGCVEGRFAATTCNSAIDIDMLGERHTDLELEGRP